MSILKVKDENGVFQSIPSIKGEKGETGFGVPNGGTSGQVLKKKTDTDYDFEWEEPFNDTYIDNLKIEILKAQNPVGHIRIETTNVNPSTYLGFGTWQLWGAGRVPVGVDTEQTEFNEVEKIGGEKTHTLTIDEMPPHKHDVSITPNVLSSGNDSSQVIYNGTNTTPNVVKNTGGGQAHNNLQPYITCYMFKRVE